MKAVSIFLVTLCTLGILTIGLSFAAYQPVPVPDGGTLTGSVKLTGTAKVEKIKPNKDQKVCGAELAAEKVVTGSGNGLANVVMTIEGVTKGKALQKTSARLSNKGCMFVPHVQCATVGGDLVIVNDDPIFHNTHLYLQMDSQKRSLRNIALPLKGKEIKQILRSAGIVSAKCDAHNWMQGYIVVLDHPYFAVTDSSGAFKIDQIPPGKYTVKAWHEYLGTQTKEITVTPKGKATLNLTFAAK